MRRLSGRPRHRWEDVIKVDLKEIGRVWNGFIQLKIQYSDMFL
jgi:hypothetical protein